MSQAVTTYQSKLSNALQEYSNAESRFKILTNATDEPLEQILILAQSLICNLVAHSATPPSKGNATLHVRADESSAATAKDNAPELVAFAFKKIYGKLHALNQEHWFAVTTLSHLQKVVAECSPKDVGLQPAQLEHLSKLGLDVSQYPEKEVECSKLVHELTEKIELLIKTITKTTTFINGYPMGLETAARQLQQTTRAKTWGDMQPTILTKTPYYFSKGYAQFLESSKSTGKSETEPTPDDLLILGTLSLLETTKKLPHNRQPGADFTGTQSLVDEGKK